MNSSPWKAMFWKECSENVRWACLAGLALSCALAYAWFAQVANPSLEQLWTSENLVLAITMPLIALVLGLLQILPELRRDQWAFLVHRPASRTTLFWGKVLPGICLYLGAAIVPLLGLAAWASSPSHVPAPFDFRFTLAGWASILSGPPFYFAGMLAALRPARWYGSRVLPILTACLAPLAASTFPEFWQAVLVCLLVTAVLLCAAWGNFLTRGEYRQQTKPARFALGLSLYPAIVAIGLGTIVPIMWGYAMVNYSGAQEYWQNATTIDVQGRVYNTSDHTDRRGHVTRTVTDASGDPINMRLWDNLNQQHKLLDVSYLPQTDLNPYYLPYANPDRYVVNLTTDARMNTWYYGVAARQIAKYTVAAHSSSVNGYLGPNGFGRDPSQAGGFEGGRPEEIDIADLQLLRFPHALYCFDLSGREPIVRMVQTLPGGPGGTGILSQTIHGSNKIMAQALIVAAGNQLLVYKPAATGNSQTLTKLFTLPIAFDPKTYSDLEVAMTADRTRFFFVYSAPGGNKPTHVVTVASNGRIIKTETMPVAKNWSAESKPRFIDAAPVLAVPAAALIVTDIYGDVGSHLGWPSAANWYPLLTVPIVFFCALGGLIAAVLSWLIRRRLGDNRRGQIAWALGIFWLGWYGVLLLLALRAWPARTPCPNCSRLRVVDRESCEHCGAVWAWPLRDGTEIFDTDSREVAGKES